MLRWRSCSVNRGLALAGGDGAQRLMGQVWLDAAAVNVVREAPAASYALDRADEVAVPGLGSRLPVRGTPIIRERPITRAGGSSSGHRVRVSGEVARQ